VPCRVWPCASAFSALLSPHMTEKCKTQVYRGAKVATSMTEDVVPGFMSYAKGIPGESGLGTGLVENWAQPQLVTRGLPHSQSQQVQ
jgi:hypothetical protein